MNEISDFSQENFSARFQILDSPHPDNFFWEVCFFGEEKLFACLISKIELECFAFLA